ncbi:MAG: TetR/AcrR family transcriptional regulator [Pseudomonadota bacterium]|mgnify:CR=1 FL=1
MARPKSIGEDELLSRLENVFREVGYEAASLAVLSKATGLQKASLYHRFPRGKAQMAQEVLSAALDCFTQQVIAPLNAAGDPEKRLALAASNLDQYYFGGRKACLLNIFASPDIDGGPFQPSIRAAFEALLKAFAKIARDGGAPASEARQRAERAVALLQGSLVLSRGLQNHAPFKRFLKELPSEILGK